MRAGCIFKPEQKESCLAPAANDAGHQHQPEPSVAGAVRNATIWGQGFLVWFLRVQKEDGGQKRLLTARRRREKQKASAVMEEEKMDSCCDTCEARWRFTAAPGCSQSSLTRRLCVAVCGGEGGWWGGGFSGRAGVLMEDCWLQQQQWETWAPVRRHVINYFWVSAYRA